MVKPLRRCASSAAEASPAKDKSTIARWSRRLTGAAILARFWEVSGCRKYRGTWRVSGKVKGPTQANGWPEWGTRVLDTSELFGVEDLVDGVGYAAFVVAEGEGPTVLFEFVAGVCHEDGQAGELEHLDVVEITSDGHDLIARDAAMFGPALECVPLGAVLIEDIDDTEVSGVVLGSENRELVPEVAVEEHFLDGGHLGDVAAEHCLNWIFGEGVFEWNDEFGPLGILLQPTLDGEIKFVGGFEDDGAFAVAIEGEYGVAAEADHVAQEALGDRGRQQVAVKVLAGGRPGNGAV